MKSIAWILALGVCFGCTPNSQSTLQGSLDPTFGTNGFSEIDPLGKDDELFAVATQSDGKIVVAGRTKSAQGGWDFLVARFSSMGALDTTFNATGFVVLDFVGSDDEARALVITSSGKIIAAGTRTLSATQSQWALACLNADGTSDTSFGPDGNGKVVTALGSGLDTLRALLVRTDGSLIAAGSTQVGGAHQVAVARYSASGVRDTTFNGNLGKLALPIGGIEDRAVAAALQPDGKVILAGFAKRQNRTDLAAVRVASNGTADAGFGPTGFATTNVAVLQSQGNPLAASVDTGNAVAVTQKNQPLVFGTTNVNNRTDWLLERFNTDGSLDSSFGSSGTAILSFGSGTSMARTIVRDSGSIYLIGDYTASATSQGALARVTASGTLDTSFASQGKELFPLSGSTEFHAATLFSGKLFVAGRLFNSTQWNGVIAKIQ